MDHLLSVRIADSLAQTIYWSIALSMVIAFVVTLMISQFDERTINGIESVWTKPLKFELSLAIHAVTLALVISCLSDTNRQSGLMIIVAAAFLAACLFEMG